MSTFTKFAILNPDWPHVGRVDNVFGDRHQFCSCVGMENYQS